MGNSDLSPSFRKRIEELRREHLGRIYEVTVDDEMGKRGDPAFKGIGSEYSLCGFVRCYGKRPEPGDRVKIMVDAINPSANSACAVAFGTVVYR